MTRFRCLAGDCEATCCGGWGIAVEPAAHRRLKVLAEHDPALGELVERGIELTPGGPDYARLRFSESGGCSMLDEAGLCGIHRKLGHAALFDVCATYPRYANQIDGELSLLGTLSCPEVARLALLFDDAFEIDSVELDEAPRKLRNSFDTQRPYFRPFPLVRQALLKLLGLSGLDLLEKLFVLLWLGDKLRPVLHSGCGPVREHDLRAIFSALGEPEVVEGLAASFRVLSLDGALALLILHSALDPRAAGAASQTARFSAILREVWGHYGLSMPAGEGQVAVDLGAVWQRYVSLRGSLPAVVRTRVDVCLTRYAQNHVLTTPYMLSENLFDYAYDLVVRVAALRFLLNTRLAEFAGTAEELDRTIVEVVFTFGRAVEHADLPHRLQATLAAQGLARLAHAVSFLAV